MIRRSGGGARIATRALACAALLVLAAACALSARPFEDLSLDLPASEDELGRWGGSDVAALSAAFEATMQARYRRSSIDEAAADLEAEGFSCFINRGYDAACTFEHFRTDCYRRWRVDLNTDLPASGATIEDISGEYLLSCSAES